MWKLICISFWTYVILTEGVTDKPSVHWWCDEIECYYSDTDTLPFEEKCDSNKSIPYRFNSTTGTCELNLIGLLLSFKVLNNRLGAVVAEKTRKSNDIIFQRVINAGIIFAGFASVCLFLGCFYCYWVQYSNHQLRRSLKIIEKEIHVQQTNKSKQKVGRKENKESGKTDRCKTMPEEVQVSVV
ncbi:uncharacterized protein LOC134794811 isoform X1 [Cydia splendana]|uniref:uncharacterized protein LOC134794811 isoform X1 n=1 Tax=Cydia splendana TaxID=1100963 RepID=UPI002130B1D5